MKRAFVLFALASACVPASEELPAAGAAGFTTVPSAQTRGETFTTSDGWNVTFEKLVVQVSVSASPLSEGYGSSEPYVFDAQKPAVLYARALPVGEARVSRSLYGRYLDIIGDYGDSDYLDRVERINVDDETNARFNRLPDDGQESNYTPGPSVLFVVRAERGGAVVRLDMALNVVASLSSFDSRGTPIEVREDQLASLELPINAEAFFPTFEEIARADADNDGNVTGNELAFEKAVLTQLELRIAAVLAR